MKNKETNDLKQELLKIQNEVSNKNNELEKFKSSMDYEKVNLTTKQEKIIVEWKQKYEKVLFFFSTNLVNNYSK